MNMINIPSCYFCKIFISSQRCITIIFAHPLPPPQKTDRPNRTAGPKKGQRSQGHKGPCIWVKTVRHRGLHLYQWQRRPVQEDASGPDAVPEEHQFRKRLVNLRPGCNKLWLIKVGAIFFLRCLD